MQHLLKWLLVLVMGVVLATPQAVLSCEPDVATCEHQDSGCGDSGCCDGAAPGGCPNCMHFGKILAVTNLGGLPIRTRLLMNLLPPAAELPEGFLPLIDQPPRKA
jgi:hypothetical protein